MKILNQGFDHVEFIVKDVDQHASMYQRMGFEKVGERKLAAKGTRSAADNSSRLHPLGPVSCCPQRGCRTRTGQDETPQ